MTNTIKISHLILELCSKEIDFGSGAPYDGGNDDHYSEWALAMALSCYEEGAEVPIEEFEARLDWAKFNQHMLAAVDAGNMMLAWSETEQDFVYMITEKGRRMVME